MDARPIPTGSPRSSGRRGRAPSSAAPALTGETRGARLPGGDGRSRPASGRAEDLARVFGQADGLGAPARRAPVAARPRARARRAPAPHAAVRARQPVARSAGSCASSTLALLRGGERGLPQGRARATRCSSIISGEVAIGETSADAVARLHRGDFFGEIALVSGAPRTSSATALSDAEILVVGKEAVRGPRRALAGVRPRRAAHGAAPDRGQRRRPPRSRARLARQQRPALRDRPARRARSRRRWREIAAVGGDAGAGRTPLGRVAEPQPLRSGAALRAALEAARGVNARTCSAGPTARSRRGSRARSPTGRAASSSWTARARRRFRPARAFHRVHHVVVAPPGGGAAPQPRAPRRDRPARAPARPAARAPRAPARRRAARAAARRARRRAAARRPRAGRRRGVGLRARRARARARGARASRSTSSPASAWARIVGAFYASQGLAGLDRLVDANAELAAAAVGAVAQHAVGEPVRAPPHPAVAHRGARAAAGDRRRRRAHRAREGLSPRLDRRRRARELLAARRLRAVDPRRPPLPRRRRAPQRARRASASTPARTSSSRATSSRCRASRAASTAAACGASSST